MLKQFSMRCADILFLISVKNSHLPKFFPYQSGVEPANEKSAIKIEARIKSMPQAADNGGFNKPPDVTLCNGILTVIHPCIEGTYNLSQAEGLVSAADCYSLLAFIRLVCTVIIIDRGGLAIHSSCILKNNKAYIFAGCSGSGKSTVVKLTQNPLLYSDEVTMVLKDEEGIFKVHHSPFRSEFHTEPLQSTSNIAGIYFLKQDTSVYTEHLSQTAALIKMFPNIFFPLTQRSLYKEKIFHLCSDFLRQVNPGVMHFMKDNSFWRCIDERQGCIKTEPGHGDQVPRRTGCNNGSSHGQSPLS